MLKSLIAGMLSISMFASVATFAMCAPCPTGPGGSAYTPIPAPVPGATVTNSTGSNSVTSTKKKVKRMIGTMVFGFNSTQTFVLNAYAPKYAAACCSNQIS